MTPPANGGAFTVRSPAFEGELLERYRSVSPPLEWEPGPEGVVEYAVTCVDRDVPEGSVAHWVVTGIPGSVTALPEGSLPEGAVAGRNDFGASGWTGPKEAGHRLFFDVFALDRQLGVRADASVHDVWSAIGEHAVATGTLVATPLQEDEHA